MAVELQQLRAMVGRIRPILLPASSMQPVPAVLPRAKGWRRIGRGRIPPRWCPVHGVPMVRRPLFSGPRAGLFTAQICRPCRAEQMKARRHAAQQHDAWAQRKAG